MNSNIGQSGGFLHIGQTEASLDKNVCGSRQPHSRPGAAGHTGEDSCANPKSEAAVLGMAALCLVTTGAAWGWFLLQMTQLFVQPEVSAIQDQVTGLAF